MSGHELKVTRNSFWAKHDGESTCAVHSSYFFVIMAVIAVIGFVLYFFTDWTVFAGSLGCLVLFVLVLLGADEAGTFGGRVAKRKVKSRFLNKISKNVEKSILLILAKFIHLATVPWTVYSSAVREVAGNCPVVADLVADFCYRDFRVGNLEAWRNNQQRDRELEQSA